MSKKRMILIVLMVLLIGVSLFGEGSKEKASSENWPDSTVQFLVGAGAGGATDLSARSFAKFFQETLKQPFVVVNQKDGGGVVAYENTRTAKPDGKTFLYYHSGMLVGSNTGLYDKSPINDFEIISVMPAGGSYAVVGGPNSKFKSMEEVIAAARANPGTITCGIQNGQSTHIMAGMLQYDSGVSFKLVEAGSDQDKLVAMQGGYIDICFINTKNAKPYGEAGKLTVFATIAGNKDRDAALPDHPSLYELGYKSCIYGTDFLILGPKGTDPNIIQKLNEYVGKGIQDQGVIDVHKAINMPLQYLTVEESIARLKETDEKISNVAKAIGLK